MPSNNVWYVAVVFLVSLCFLIFLVFIFFISIRARCNWPQLLRCPCQRSFCLFVCFLAEANEIKNKITEDFAVRAAGTVTQRKLNIRLNLS